MEFITLPSKINDNSLDELDLLDPNTSGVIIDKLLHLQGKFNLSHLLALKSFAGSLALLECNKPLNNRKKATYIRWDNKKEAWTCRRRLNGIDIRIKTSKNRDLVEKAHEEFCKLHNIEL